MFRSIPVVFLLALVVACSLTETGKTGQHIADQTWRVMWLKGWGFPEHVLQEGSEAMHIRLTTDGRVTGSGGCNRIAGAYRETGGQIEFSQMISTRRACIAGMEREDAFLKALEITRFWQRRGDRLLLNDAEGRILLELKPISDKPESAAQ